MNNGIFAFGSSQTFPAINSSINFLGIPSKIETPYGSPQGRTPQVNYDNLVIVIDTTKEATNVVTLPIQGTVNCTVDWGDGLTDRYTAAGNRTHTYSSRGEYTIQIYGSFTALTFSSTTNNRAKIIKCLSFGNVGLTSFNFTSCTNLVEVPSLLPTGVTSLANCFNGCSIFNWPIDSWDVSRITSLASTFANSSFNRSLNSWNTSRVTSLASTFINNSSFNEAIGNWNTSNVGNISQTFEAASRFNQSISSWDTSKITDMYRAFFNSAFNQPIGDWNTSSLVSLQQTFYNCPYNHPLSGWNTSNVTNLIQTFALNGAFNQPINNWNVSKVTNFTETFRDCAYNQPLSGWDVSNATTFNAMFYGSSRFNQLINNWNVGKATDFGTMFGGAPTNGNTSYNQSISGWNIGANIASGATVSFASMFAYNRVFNQNIESLDVGRVSNFSSMFTTNGSNPSVFNQSLSGWSSTMGTGVTTINMSSMFNGATLFNQPLSSWNISKVNNFSSMFAGSNFNNSLSGWQIGSGTGVTSVDMTFMFNGAAAFNNSVADWTFHKPTNMNNSFYNTATFNHPSITGWINTSGITDMGNMFYNNRVFNQPIGSWNTSNVTSMANMFNFSLAFNQSLNYWNVGKVTTFAGMFVNAGINQDFSNWTISGINAANGIDSFMQNVTTMSTTNYDNILVSWESKKTSLRADLRPHFGASKYTASGSAASTARASLVAYGWTVTDGGSVIRTPDPPTAVTGTGGDAEVSLSWTAPIYNNGSNITDYAIQYSSNSGSSWTLFSDGVSTSTTGLVTGLINGTTYVFRVATINVSGTGSYSQNSNSIELSIPYGQSYGSIKIIDWL